MDTAIWVQADFAEAERRGIERDVADGVNGDRERAIAFWHDWMAAELRFLDEQRPWERADVIVAGTPTIALGHRRVGHCKATAADQPVGRRQFAASQSAA